MNNNINQITLKAQELTAIKDFTSPLKIFSVKCTIFENLKIMQNALPPQLLMTKLLRIYYFILQNEIYITVNQENLRLIKHELQMVQFLMPYFSNNTEEIDLNLFPTLVEYYLCLENINLKRIDFLNTNTNPGRSAIVNYFLYDIKDLEEHQKTLEKKLNL